MAEVSNLIQEVPTPMSKAEEDNRIKALVNTPALDWKHTPCPNGFRQMVRGHGYGDTQKRPRQSYVWRRPAVHVSNITSSKSIPDVLPTMNNADIGGRNFVLQQSKVPPGYVCHRCNVPGHLIKYCPTNDDPYYDIKRVAPPRSMLMAASDGSYVLPTSTLAVVKPDEATFEKEMEGIIPSTLPLSGPEISSSNREQKLSPGNEEERKVQNQYGFENYMMMAAYNDPYWNGMGGFVSPLPLPYEGAMMQMMNYYGLGPFHMTMPFGGLNNYMFPVLPPPRDITRDRQVNSSGDISSKNCIPPSSSPDQSSGNLQPSCPSKIKSDHYSDSDRSSDHHHHRSKSLTRPAAKSSFATTKATATTERRRKADDFSGGSIHERQVSKKRKLTTSCLTEPGRKLATSTRTHHKAIPARGGGEKKSTIDYRSSDDERHYRWRLPKASWEEERRHKHKRRYY